MKPQLVRTIHRNQRCHRCQAAVAFGELRALPNVAEQNVIGKLDEFGCEVANHFLGG
jgi:hypothetical protein